MVEAFAQLRDVPARIKHVILFSDAADAEEKSGGEMGDGAKGGGSSLDLASAMLSSKITTSVVALGLETDRDTGFLRQLAERGNGRFYLTSDATTLPQIFSTETMKVAQSSLVEEPFQAVAVRTHPILGGVDWTQSPLLLGYNSTKPKPAADILLTSERGEPLLVMWRYGLGQAAAFTSDAKARWASEWLGWPGYGKFWAQLVRGLMRKSDRAGFAIATAEEGDRLTLKIDAVKPDGGFLNQLPITVHALRQEVGSAGVPASATPSMPPGEGPVADGSVSVMRSRSPRGRTLQGSIFPRRARLSSRLIRPICPTAARRSATRAATHGSFSRPKRTSLCSGKLPRLATAPSIRSRQTFGASRRRVRHSGRT
jgi:hypothetical protein